MTYGLVYFLTFLVFLAVDMVWLGLVARQFYAAQLGHLMTPNVNWVAAILFYLLFIVGILVFVILPARERQSVAHAIGYGALFGLMTYATYDLTNLATLRDWPLIVTVIDLLWGMTVSGIVSFAGYHIARAFGL